MGLLNKIKTEYNDYKTYKKRKEELDSEYRHARSRIILLTTFIKRGLRVEESQACIEMEIFLYDSLVHSFLYFTERLSYVPHDIGTVVHFIVQNQTKLEELAAPYLLQ